MHIWASLLAVSMKLWDHGWELLCLRVRVFTLEIGHPEFGKWCTSNVKYVQCLTEEGTDTQRGLGMPEIIQHVPEEALEAKGVGCVWPKP